MWATPSSSQSSSTLASPSEATCSSKLPRSEYYYTPQLLLSELICWSGSAPGHRYSNVQWTYNKRVESFFLKRYVWADDSLWLHICNCIHVPVCQVWNSEICSCFSRCVDFWSNWFLSYLDPYGFSLYKWGIIIDMLLFDLPDHIPSPDRGGHISLIT